MTVVCETISLDDLYHPHTLEHYDPECCCAYCLDVSIARERQGQSAFYRKLRREGKGKLARLYWKYDKAIMKKIADSLSEQLYGSPSSNQIGGLQALLED